MLKLLRFMMLFCELISIPGYSCCFFPDKSSSLEDAEKAMLELYCERSQLKDGLTVLDVGCGWGSLSLYIAQKYPNCQVTGVCNSTTQKTYIEEKCRYFPYSFFDNPDPIISIWIPDSPSLVTFLCANFLGFSGKVIHRQKREVLFSLTKQILFDIRRMEDKIKFEAQSVIVYLWLMFNAWMFFVHVTSEIKIRIGLTTTTFYHRELQLQNVDIIVADISTFDMEASYDRIFSIEMFEVLTLYWFNNMKQEFAYSWHHWWNFFIHLKQHMKNYQGLLKKISKWMNSDSLLFIHYFCHKTFAYHFEVMIVCYTIIIYFFVF